MNEKEERTQKSSVDLSTRAEHIHFYDPAKDFFFCFRNYRFWLLYNPALKQYIYMTKICIHVHQELYVRRLIVAIHIRV
jgi:hypothetical protein